jgi:hypothetical protein
MVLAAALGVGLILAGTRVLSLSSVWRFLDTLSGSILVILVGVALLIIAVHYLIQLADERLAASLFRHQGSLGSIDLSPAAVRELISGVLRDDIGLERFHVLLRHDVDGIGIVVRTTLFPDQRVTEIGELIQRTLAEHVVDRTGIAVSDVTVLVRGIRGRATAT